LEAFDLFLFLTADLHFIAGRQRACKSFETRPRRLHHLGWEHAFYRETGDRDRAKLISSPELFRLHPVFDGRNLLQRDTGAALRRVDVEVVDVSELRAFLHSQSRDDWNLFVSFAQAGHPMAAHGRRGRGGYVKVGDAGHVRAVGVRLELDRETLVAPIIADATAQWNRAENLFNFFSLEAQETTVFPGQPDRPRQPNRFARLELPNIHTRSGDFGREGLL